ncbi:hypothetical protein CORC01_07389 [Colletotrichum orchidophilum]|uniref:BTB domain-containing protein n=1 Tax=Colletotrichum orchidophilum TaxID=1209926 RepID=A0A1G4B7G4_9PEZI|nr:uncharacterized protein CORC01_07389 [Colletotrichum orchidophilum]OHE97334.1 hypothetical protein CORC01_07389 [Colletotrichum orchidophilum]
MLGKRKRFEDMDVILQSRSIKFIVGPEKKEYTVYESSFSALSPPLRALLTGGFQESNEGKVIWDDTDPVTFVLLVQYAYGGDYSLPEPPAAVEKVAIDEKTDGKAEEMTKKKTPGGSSRLEALFPTSMGMDNQTPTRQHRGSQHLLAYGKPLFPPSHKAESIDIETWFAEPNHPKRARVGEFETTYWSFRHLRSICQKHAALYFLADKYIIEDLKHLFLDKIRHFLLHCRRTPNLRNAVMALVKLAYAETVPGDGLRSLLVRHCLSDMAWFDTSKFKDLVRCTPEFGVDLFCEIPRSHWRESRKGEFEC